MNPQTVATWVAAIVSVGVIVDSCEMLATRSAFAASGIYSYDVLCSARRFMLTGLLAAPLRTIFAYPGVLVLPAFQIAAGTVLIAQAIPGRPGAAPPVYTAAAILVLASRAMLYMRNQVGLDGSDQMLLVVFIGVVVVDVAPDRLGQDIGLYYIAAQFVIAYWTSGIAKAISPVWRGGAAVPRIMATTGYGYPPLGRFLQTRPRLSKALCWSVIAVECLAPLLVLGGPKGAAVLVILAVGLHGSIALLMGLNCFFWSFMACTPAVCYLADAITHLRR